MGKLIGVLKDVVAGLKELMGGAATIAAAVVIWKAVAMTFDFRAIVPGSIEMWTFVAVAAGMAAIASK